MRANISISDTSPSFPRGHSFCLCCVLEIVYACESKHLPLKAYVCLYRHVGGCCSVAKPCWFFVTPWTATCQAPLCLKSPGVCPNSCPFSWWCYLTILSLATSFSFCLPSFPASESFPVSQLFASAKSLEL